MFNVHINDGSKPIPNDDICYIIGKDGIYLKKKLGMVESCTKVDNISILNPVNIYGKIHLPKIPSKVFCKVVSFFRAAYEKYKGESAIVLYFNEKKNQYKIVVPEQKVSGVAVDYEVDTEQTVPGYKLVGTIHSHANFGAFHSGTDQNDEKNFDGLHITVGNVAEPDGSFSLSTSVVINASRFIEKSEDYLEDVISTDGEKKTFVVEGKIYEYISQANKDRFIFKDNVKDEDFEFNPKWMDKVEAKKYITYYSAGNSYTPHWQNWFDHDDYDRMMQYRKDAPYRYKGKYCYKNANGKHSKKNGNRRNDNIIQFPNEKHEEDLQINMFKLNEAERNTQTDVPCEKCIYKDLKLDIIIDEIDEQAEELKEEKDELRQYVRQMYPDLPDNEVDKVMEGMHFE